MSQTSISEISSGGDVTEEEINELKDLILENDGLKRLNRRKLEEIVTGSATLSGSDIGNYQPEHFTRQYFINELLDFLGYDSRKGEFTGEVSGDNPDYKFDLEDRSIIAEAKSLGKIKKAEDDMEDYLNRKDLQTDYGIATDGVSWTVMKYENGQVSKATVSLLPVFLDAVGQQSFSDDTAELREFISYLRKNSIFDSADDVAIEFKRKKKEVTQDFFDEYIKLVFGSDGEYCLLDAITPASNAPTRDVRLFGVEFMNKLIFIKFLEDREIIREDLIGELWREYKKSSSRQTFYKHTLQPLFFRVMNTPEGQRDDRIDEDELIGDIEYLNGGLFRESVDNEPSYDVDNDIIEEIIDRLIEPYSFTVGTEGESLDPSILGKVFEKTINFLTAEEEDNRQKLKGAYYTPDDVTTFLSEESLKPYIYDKIKEELTENHGLNEQSFETMYDELDDIIANPQNEAVMRHIYEEIVCDVKILDPSCGSGHFLTSVLDELFWIRKSFCDKFDIDYESDRHLIEEIIKENVYGVDVEEPAVEIAKLRLWLRILYEAEKDQELSKLPNIDYNIRAGNSLIGFIDPQAETGGDNGLVTESLDSQLRTYWDDIESFREDDYEGSADDMKDQIDELNKEMEQPLNKWYANENEARIKEGVENVDRLEEIMDGGREVKRKFTVYKSLNNNEEFTDREKDLLNENEFSTYKYKAYVKINPEDIKKKTDLQRVLDVLDEVINSVNAEKFEIEREVLREDIQDTGSFHWIMEFEEVVNRGGFDIVIGNPPYGQDIMSEKEVSMLENWDADGCRDICGYFLERETQLVKEGGYISNIIAGSLAVNNSFTSVRDLMRETGDYNLSFFGIRPSKIFDTVDERVCIVTGKIDGECSPIKTAKNQRFTQEMRETLFDEIQYASTEGLLLGSKIGVRENQEDTRLPKIGNKEIKNVLENLKEYSQERILSDITEGESKKLEFRTSARYWINALIDFPYNSSKVETLEFESELHRDFALVSLNSSLFYVYWSVYGNNRDVFKNLVGKFPVPPQEDLEEHSDKIKELASKADKDMASCFDSDAGTVGEFDTKQCKSTINKLDQLLAKIYGFQDEVEFIQNFDSQLRPNPSNLEDFS